MMSSSFKTSLFTISIVSGFKHLYACLLGLLSSSSSILCIHVEGDIPLMSVMVHPTTSLCSWSTLTSLSSFVLLNLLEIISGRVSHSLNNMYFRCSGSDFGSSLGAYKKKGEKSCVKSKKINIWGITFLLFKYFQFKHSLLQIPVSHKIFIQSS